MTDKKTPKVYHVKRKPLTEEDKARRDRYQQLRDKALSSGLTAEEEKELEQYTDVAAMPSTADNIELIGNILTELAENTQHYLDAHSKGVVELLNKMLAPYKEALERHPELSNLDDPNTAKELADLLGVDHVNEILEADITSLIEALDDIKGFTDPLPAYLAIPPKEAVFQAGSAHRDIFGGQIVPAIYGAKVKAHTTGTGAKVLLNINELEGVTIHAPFTPDDHAIYTAVSMLKDAGNTSFTINQVYRAMTYEDETDPQGGPLYPSEKRAQEIEEAIEKGMRTKVSINTTKESKKPDDPSYKKIYSGNLYDLRAGELIMNNQRTKGYVFLADPILFEYAKARREIQRAPLAALKIPNKRYSSRNITARNYVISQIGYMMSGRRLNNIMLLDTIIKASGNYDEKASAKTRGKQRREMVEVITAVLDNLTEIEYINAYETISTTSGRGTTVTGFEVELNPREAKAKANK